MSCDQELQKWSWTYQIGAYMYKNGVAPPLSTQSTKQFHSTKEAAEQKGGGKHLKKNHRREKLFKKIFVYFFFE